MVKLVIEVERIMGKNIRVVFGALLLVGFCCFLLFDVTIPRITSVGVKERVTRRHEGSVLNFVSKRRVPNGPDPIHNRKIGNTRQPPERA